MKPKLTLALVALITGTAFGSMPAVLPEFKDAKQLAEWRAEKAFEVTSPSYASEKTIFYTGKPYLTLSGNYTFKYRSYDSAVARWTSEDPSGFPDGANNSMYSCNAPVNGIDADGLVFLLFRGEVLTAQSGDGYQQNGEVDFGDVVHSWGAVSGPHGNGALPNGWYSVTAGAPLTSSQRDTQRSDGSWNNGTMSVWNNGDRAKGFSAFKFNLDVTHDTPAGGRTDLRIHPDGGVAGTEGCVGITSYADCVAAYTYITANLGGLELYVE